MLRWIWRTLIILLVAGSVSGGVYALWLSGAGASLLGTNNARFGGEHLEGQRRGAGSNNALPGQFQPGTRPQGQRGGGEFGRGGGDFGRGISLTRGMAGVVRNLVIIGVITIVIVAIQFVITRLRRGKRSPVVSTT